MSRSPARRARLRERRRQEHVEYMRQVAIIKAAGGSCRTCSHIKRMPTDNRRHCSLESDSDGYQIVAMTHACPRFNPKDPNHV